MKKYCIAFAVLFELLVSAFSSSYRINSVHYVVEGMTKESLVEREVKIDKTIIFPDEVAFAKYIDDYRQRLLNTRLFDEVSIDYSTRLFDEQADLYIADLTVRLDDSFHFIIMPYPKYDSNSGLTLKLKLKDTNFFGTMKDMSSDINFMLKTDEDDTEMKHIVDDMGITMGVNLTFDIPFRLVNLNAMWTNSYGISYTIGHSSPEWDAATGLDFSVPLGHRTSLDFSFTQGFTRNFDYQKYEDDTYFTEKGKVSLPIVLQRIDNWGSVDYTPYVSATHYWDFDGISNSNEDLASPQLAIGQTIGTSRINWKNNLRTGLSISTTQSFTYIVQNEKLQPKFSAEFKGFKGFGRIGIASDLYFFMMMNGTENIGSRLRGIRDKQYFSSSSGYGDSYACKTSGALAVNLDFPIRVFTTHFEKNRVMRKLNFEVQVAPFIDFALIHNKAAGTIFSIKDGFYAGGLEVIVFPESWKSIQFRASLGIDAGRYFLKRFINTDWRRGVSKYELSIGIGLHY
ncbi:hypothetical protein [Treponema sp. Marseille-Q4130]|uniref:hypothetical protein n=1 Tax=Treponema sp. Marseille-Q4130 TaxID=2766702 RepID=UPI0016526742|nr:hypothetical protein [Treponema sp. Marseille-Q4130]MBC6719937.1 hypothetical protein [Treponema sp. Marseille-Q4130]